MRNNKLRHYLFLILCILFLSALSHAELKKGIVGYKFKNLFAPITHSVPLRIVYLSQSRWTTYDISKDLQEAAYIFSQCGVSFDIVDIHSVKDHSGEVIFDLEGYSEVNETWERGGSLELAKKISDGSEVLTVFFIEGFDPQFGSITATSVPIERVKRNEQKVALNTVWMTQQVLIDKLGAQEDGLRSSGYNVLAHELGHILLDSSHITENYIHNLMHSMPQNLNGRLTLNQCSQIKSSRLAKNLKQSLNKNAGCSNIHNSIRGGVQFFENMISVSSNKYCRDLSDLTELLSSAQDKTSDLQPAKHLDFYLQTNAGSEVAYLDRHAFDGTLKLSYDINGKALLSKKQSQAMWLHELGHAILNAQLKTDWDWFESWEALMLDWGRTIFKITLLDNSSNSKKELSEVGSMEELQNQTDAIVQKISSFPNRKNYEIFIDAYHEFFADAFVIIHSRDPKIMMQALVNPADPEGKKSSYEELQERENRDYSYLRDITSWSVETSHGYFTPALAHLWLKITQMPSFRTSQEVTRTVYNAVLLEITERAKNPELWDITPSEANKRLIKRLNF